MVKIVVDSACDIRREEIEDNGCAFDSVPLSLQIEDRVYIDDENLDIDTFIGDMESSPTHVKSSAPAPSLFMDKYTGPESVFVVTISSRLSSTYQSAMLAKRMYLEEYGRKFIHVFDSLSASVGEGLVALKIAELAKKGLPNLEIVEHVNKFLKSMRTYILLDKFDLLVKTGRVSPYIAKLASFLNIKPLCRDDENGNIKLLEKARGYGKAVSRMIEIIKESTPDLPNRIVAISHTKCLEKAQMVKDEILKLIAVKDVIIESAAGLVTSYANRGGIVVAV